MYPYDNQNQLSQLLLQQIQPQTAQTKVIEVTGRAGTCGHLLPVILRGNEARYNVA